MGDKNLQVENGNFTRIINPVIDNLIKIPFKGCEIPLALFIIRKTWGFHKTQDEISLTQMETGINKSRPTIVKALKNLQLVNILKLVKRGSYLKDSNLWAINKYTDTWELVKVGLLVKRNTITSKAMLTDTSKATLTHKRKYKRKQKNTISAKADDIFSFKGYVDGLLKDKRRHIHIIGLYWSYMGESEIAIRDKATANAQLTKNLKAGQSLTSYTDEEIKNAFEILDEKSKMKKNFDWSLNAVINHIKIIKKK